MRIAINALSVQRRSYGGGNYIRNLVRHLAKIDTENDYRVYVSDRGLPHFTGLGANVCLVAGYSNRPLRLLWEQTGLPVDLSRSKAALFHGAGFVSPLRRVCPQITTIHDMTWFVYPERHTLWKRCYFRTMIPLCVRRSDAVIAMSESVKQDIVRILAIQPEKVKVIYHGKDERFHPIHETERLARLRNKYGFHRKVILFVGLLEPRKNLATLIQAFARLKTLHRDYCLVLAGEIGWDSKHLLGALTDCGIKDCVHFPGFIPDDELPELYNLAEVFVYPSLYEGFGLPVLEAMACGVPVITSDVSSMPEVAGGAGLLVSPASVEGLSQAMYRVLTDGGLRTRMREKGLERSRLFSWEKMARETLEVYREVVRQNSAARSSGRKATAGAAGIHERS